jgi:hypothetical protein
MRTREELSAVAALQAHDFNAMAKAPNGTANQNGGQKGDKGLTVEEQLQKGLDNMASGSSDAEFEKLLGEVCSRMPFGHGSLKFTIPLGSEVCWHAPACILCLMPPKVSAHMH